MFGQKGTSFYPVSSTNQTSEYIVSPILMSLVSLSCKFRVEVTLLRNPFHTLERYGVVVVTILVRVTSGYVSFTSY